MNHPLDPKRTPQKQAFYEKVAKTFSYPKFQLNKDLASFRRMIDHQKFILDIGSGAEKPYQELFGADVHIGIDLFDPSDIKGDIKALPFMNDCADVVLCTEVLEHVPEPPLVLREMNRILKDDKYLILTVPLLWGEHDHVDYQRWTERGLRKLLDDSGYDTLVLNRRGGLFSSIGCHLAHAPHEIFGAFSTHKNWAVKAAYLVFAVAVLPLPWFFSMFDFLDRKKSWTIGYSVLCKKRKKDMHSSIS
jgi:SAM-dependent methyltransferase